MPPEKPVVRSLDYLGRSISDQKRAIAAKSNGKLHSRSLHPKSGEDNISVDKLIRTSEGECEFDDSHVLIAKTRKGTFYGWGYFTRREVEDSTPCVVQPKAIDDNPNHVLIRFPEIVKSCRKKRNEIARELANISRWLEHLDPTVCWSYFRQLNTKSTLVVK